MKPSFKLFSTLFLVIFISIFSAKAQQEQVLGFTQELWQSNLTNPAMLPEKKIHIMLPSVLVTGNSDYSLNDFIHVDAESGRRQLVDTIILAKLTNSNKLAVNTNIQTIGVSFPISKKMRISINHAVVGDNNFDIKGDLARAVVRGISQFAGKTVSFGSSEYGNLRNELGVSIAYALNSNINLGVRVKLLSGVAAVFTPTIKVDATFDAAAKQINFNNDFSAVTFSENKIKDIAGKIINPFSSNRGFSFDLGGTYKVGKLNLSASLLDIGGSINWKSEGKTYSTKGNFIYNGNDAPGLFNPARTGYVDTLKKYIGYTETASATYTQNLPLRIYLSATYDVNNFLRLGALFYNEGGNNSSSGIVFDASTHLGKIINFGLNYGSRYGNFNNLGTHLTLKLGPLQFYGLTDNILALLKPYDAKSASGRVGLNLVF